MPGDRLRALSHAVWSAWDDDLPEARVMTLLAAEALHDPRIRGLSEGAWAATAAVYARCFDETLAVLGLRPRVETEVLARWALGAAAGMRLTRGDSPDPRARRAVELCLYGLVEL
jgi:hypothetical protein